METVMWFSFFIAIAALFLFITFFLKKSEESMFGVLGVIQLFSLIIPVTMIMLGIIFLALATMQESLIMKIISSIILILGALIPILWIVLEKIAERKRSIESTRILNLFKTYEKAEFLKYAMENNNNVTIFTELFQDNEEEQEKFTSFVKKQNQKQKVIFLKGKIEIIKTP